LRYQQNLPPGHLAKSVVKLFTCKIIKIRLI
jgi:hypothetical protein